MNRMKVIMFGPDLDVQGGISSVEREYFFAGLDKKVDLIFVPTHKDGLVLKKIYVFVGAFMRAIYFSVKYKKAIFHIHVSQKGSFFRKFIIFCLGKMSEKKIITHVHGSDFEGFMHQSKIHKYLTRFLFNKSDQIIVLSNLWRENLLDFIENRNIKTLYNPISLKYPISQVDDKVTVLFLGRLGQRKGVYDILECVKNNKKYFLGNKIKFILAGDGDVQKIRTIIQESRLDNIINVPGWVSGCQKEKFLVNSHIIILPSYNEQMPMSILEGMSYGYPIIATNIAGIPEMVEHGKNGLLFSPGDIETMGKCIIELASKPDLRKRMGESSRDIVREKFESHRIIDQLVGIYEAVYVQK